MSKLVRTSVQLEPEIIRNLKTAYPTLTLSQIIRLCCEYTLAMEPKLERGRDLLVDTKVVKTKQSAKVNGGIARSAKLSPERRKEIASIAAHKRWNKLS